MIEECRIIRCFHGRYAADYCAGCIVEGDAGGNGGIVVTQADSNLCGAAVEVGGNEIVLDEMCIRDSYLLWHSGNFQNSIFKILIPVAAIAYMMTFVYAFPLLARFNNTAVSYTHLDVYKRQM